MSNHLSFFSLQKKNLIVIPNFFYFIPVPLNGQLLRKAVKLYLRKLLKKSSRALHKFLELLILIGVRVINLLININKS